MTMLCRAKLNHLYVYAKKNYNLFIEIIRSLSKSSVTKSDPTFRKYTTIALILYIFLIIWTWRHVEAIVVLVQKRVFFPIFPHKTRPKLNGSIRGERHLKDH